MKTDSNRSESYDEAQTKSIGPGKRPPGKSPRPGRREPVAEPRRFRELLDHAPVPIFVHHHGRFIFANPAAVGLHGVEQPDGLIGRELADFVHPEDRARFATILASAPPLNAGKRVSTIRLVRADGRVVELEATSVPVTFGGQAARLVICNDITDRKRSEEERERLHGHLRQAQKMEAVGQLAGSVAHDFNNILTAIIGNVELTLRSLERQLPADSAPLEGLRQIERAAQRAADLTRQLLLVSRRNVTHMQVLDLNQALTNAASMLERLLTENIRLVMKLTPNLAPIRADAGQTEQVLLNLVVNARDAMPNGGRIVIETNNVMLDDAYVNAQTDARPGRHVLLSVSDTGEGMTQDVLERIFEPFFTTKSAGQGTGLGLSTVYGIVKQAGGHVAVYSEPGRGTTFKVFLPASDERVVKQHPARAIDQVPRGTETVMLCEDNIMVRRMTKTLLESAGYTVIAAADGEHAIELAKHQEKPIDMLITDVIMPGMDGKRLADTLRSTHPGLRSLFVSGYTADVIAHHGVLDENVTFLQKPFSRSDLLRRMREVLDEVPDTEGRIGSTRLAVSKRTL